MDIRKRREAQRERNRQKIASARASHTCLRCGVPLPEGETRLECDACRERTRAAQHERYEFRRESGACVWCGRIAGEGFSTCAACRKKARERERAERQARPVFIARKRGEDPITGPVAEIAGVLGCCRKSVYRAMRGQSIRKLAGWHIRRMTDEEAAAWRNEMEGPA